MTVVLEHVLDEAAGVYRLVIGEPVEVAEDEDPVFDQVREVVWAADDARWFTGKRRRAMAEVAAEQRGLVAAQLADHARAEERIAEAREAGLKKLPGVGDAL